MKSSFRNVQNTHGHYWPSIIIIHWFNLRRIPLAIAVQQISETGTNPAPWTCDEQKVLEQALKTYPTALGKERWVSIAAVLPNRSKRDCMNRYKVSRYSHIYVKIIYYKYISYRYVNVLENNMWWIIFK